MSAERFAKYLWSVIVSRNVANRRRRIAAHGRPGTVAEACEPRMLLTNPLDSIPVLNSLPGAPVEVYLDFDGHVETHASWNNGNTIDTPVYDVDSDLTTFSDEELRRMEELWYRVSEDFAPFNVNVTTVEPAQIADFESIRVAIGGDGAWLGAGGVVGVALLDAFSSASASNTVFVFSAVDPTVKHIANTISHEAGHAFGLQHQSSYDAAGNKTAEYRPGLPDVGPLMGFSDGSLRDIWDTGPNSLGPTVIQDDMEALAKAANRTFVFRNDDHGNSIATATPVSFTGATGSVNGIIERTGDVDFFRFTTDTGSVSFSVTGLDLRQLYPGLVNNPGTNLDITLELYDETGNLIASDAPTNSLTAAVTAQVSQGNYYVAVHGGDEYGSTGEYTLTGTVIPLAAVPTMLGPVGVLTQLAPQFSWSIGANAASYELEVIDVRTNEVVYTRANLTGTTHTSGINFPEGSYSARVRAIGTNGNPTEWSNSVQFSIDIAAPSRPVIRRPDVDITDETFPQFAWSAENANYYTLWVSRIVPNANGTGNTLQRVIYRTDHTGFVYTHLNALPEGTYIAWVQAFNSVGERSLWSEPKRFTIDIPTPDRTIVTDIPDVVQDTSITVRWNPVEHAARYDVWVDSLTERQSQFIRDPNVSGTSLALNDLPQGTYRVWVRAINGNNENGRWSVGETFTLDILAPTVPTVNGPTGTGTANIVDTSKPTVTWTAVDRAASYELWINYRTPDGSRNVTRAVHETGLTETSFAFPEDAAEGLYRVWVRAFNSADEPGDWSAEFRFNIDVPIPSIPTITAPIPNSTGSVETATPTIRWTGQIPGVEYDVWMNNVTTGASQIIRVSVDQPEYTVPTENHLVENIYRVWVRSRNVEGEYSRWSEGYTFRVDVPNPTTPVLFGPSGNSDDTTPLFEWQHTDDSVSYQLLVRDLERQENIVINIRDFDINPSNNRASFESTHVFAPGTYRFWIRAFNSLDTASSWSAARAFSISAADLPALKNGATAEPDVLLASLLTAQPPEEHAPVDTATAAAEAQRYTEAAPDAEAGDTPTPQSLPGTLHLPGVNTEDSDEAVALAEALGDLAAGQFEVGV